MLLLRAGADSPWLAQLAAATRKHPSCPAIVCDAGAPVPDLHAALRLPRIQLAPNVRAIRLAGNLVLLKPKDYAVVELLYSCAARAVPRARIHRHVWEGQLPAASRSLDVRVSHVRKILRRHVGAGPPRIETISGVGYRLRL